MMNRNTPARVPLTSKWKRTHMWIVVVLLWFGCTAPRPWISQLHVVGETYNVADDERYQLGKERYEAIKRESRGPRYSQCWLDAIDSLEQGCKHLTDDIQHRLALQYANCFLQKTGRDTYPCELGKEISECTKNMQSDAYNTYTEFFTHTQNICFFLQGQKWQEQTEATVHRLADSSQTVAQQIEDSTFLQTEMMKQQNQSIENQELLIQRGNELKQTLEASTVNVHHMLTEFKDTTTEQRQLIFEVFDRVNSLRSVVMGEFTGFYSLIFYAVSIILIYLLTSTPRTSDARFWLFVLMTVNIVLERVVAMFKAEQQIDHSGVIIDESTIVYGRLWYCRKVSTTVGVFLWCWVAWRYKNLVQVNNQLLVEIKRQNSELKQLLKAYPAALPAEGTQTYLPNGSAITAGSECTKPEEKHPDDLPVPREPKLIKNLADVKGPLNTCGTVDILDGRASIGTVTSGYASDSESDCSSLSGRTDDSFHFSENGEDDDSDTSSFFTVESGRHSREGTPALLRELYDIRQATPLREMTPVPFDSSPNFPTPGSSGGRRRGRPPGCKNKVYCATPGRYNLRSIRGKRPYFDNPILQTESPDSFGHAVNQMMKTSMENASKVHAVLTGISTSTPQKSPHVAPAFFSSDED